MGFYAEGYLVRFLIVSFLGGTEMEGVASVLLLAFKADLNDERCKEQDQGSQPVRILSLIHC